MRIRRRTDTWLLKLSAVTGITNKNALIELGRLVDDIVTADKESVLIADWTGDHHAVAVLHGRVSRAATGRWYEAGETFVSNPLETVRSDGAVALIGPVGAAARLATLLAGRRGPDIDGARAQRRTAGVLLQGVR
jgi:hypothetical protein